MGAEWYVLRELEQVAHRAQVLQTNAAVVRQTQAEVRGKVGRETILAVLREGRGE